MVKFKLSALFIMAVLSVVGAVPLLFGLSVESVAGAAAFVLLASLFVERGHVRYTRSVALGQLGKVGAEDDDDGVKAQVLKALKDHSLELTRAIEKTETDVKEFGKVAESTKNEIAALNERGAELESRLAAVEQKTVRGESGPARQKSLGELFTEWEGTTEFCERAYANGGLQARGSSRKLELKDVTSAAASAGDGIWSFRDPEIVKDPYRPLMMRDLIPTVPVGSNLVEWVQVNVRTNNADVVSETGTKPKSDITYDRKETAVRKIAHYFKTSAEVLADFARLRAELDSEGFEMLRQVEEDQLLSGDGTGENLLGLIPSATDYNTALTASGDQQVDVIRHAILQVRQSFYGATGVVLNPADWEAIELLKDGENRYLLSDPTMGAMQRLWGLPVVASDAMPAGQFMVGAFRTSATIYDRMAAAVFLSTENEDDFIKNMVSVLFEERLALAVKRPLAIVHGNLSGA